MQIKMKHELHKAKISTMKTLHAKKLDLYTTVKIARLSGFLKT